MAHGKESACNAGDLGLILGSGRSPGEENGHPLQSSCLENPMDRGAWPATVHGAEKNQTQLSDKNFHSPPPQADKKANRLPENLDVEAAARF